MKHRLNRKGLFKYLTISEIQTTMRDNELIKLRPLVATETEREGEIENFQNQTIRPILKLQNDLLVRVFDHHLRKRKTRAGGAAPLPDNFIQGIVRKDAALRHLLIGLVAGHFTLAEWAFFARYEAELSRRTANLIVQRLQSQSLPQPPPEGGA